MIKLLAFKEFCTVIEQVFLHVGNKPVVLQNTLQKLDTGPEQPAKTREKRIRDKGASGKLFVVLQRSILNQLRISSQSHRLKMSLRPTRSRYQDKVASLKRQLLNSRQLFEDKEFPPSERSLAFARRETRRLVWKRPHEISKSPHFFSQGVEISDVTQGTIRNCWFVAAMADLTMNSTLFDQVCPRNQSFEKGSYCGLFHFNFWRFGEWKEVIIDDYLPTFNGRLYFTHSSDSDEFWSALLEKAYAKVCGSYEAMGLGRISEALQDFTGGVIEIIDVNQQNPNLFNIISKAHERQSLMGCSIESQRSSNDGVEGYLDNGLITKHAYSITGVTKVSLNCIRGRPDVELLRIRNPHGNDAEWKGAWSDRSREWNMLSPKERERLQLNFDDDGEFWMSAGDFARNFSRLEICMLTPDSLDNEKKQWQMKKETGRWQRGVSAGGCRNFIETFHTNPQFRIKLQDPDDDDGKPTCSIVVSLMRVHHKTRSSMMTQPAIGFAIYEIPSEAQHSERFDREFFQHNKAVGMTTSFTKMRDITCRYSFPPGDYLIVPSTFQRNQDLEFLLRIFSEKRHEAREIDQPTKMNFVPKVVITQQDASEIDTQFWDDFHQAAGEDGEVDQYELQDILSRTYRHELNSNPFCLEACRSMISMFDTDRSGALGYNEFRALRILLLKWQKQFHTYDRDNSGDMNIFELRNALKGLGYQLSNAALSSVVLRYHNKKGTISFDTFIQIVVRVIVMFDTFQKNSTDSRSSKKATFTLDQFIDATLTA